MSESFGLLCKASFGVGEKTFLPCGHGSNRKFTIKIGKVLELCKRSLRRQRELL
jgi:hypothetical protein